MPPMSQLTKIATMQVAVLFCGCTPSNAFCCTSACDHLCSNHTTHAGPLCRPWLHPAHHVLWAGGCTH